MVHTFFQEDTALPMTTSPLFAPVAQAQPWVQASVGLALLLLLAVAIRILALMIFMPTLRRVRAPDVTPYPSVDMAPGLKPPIL